MLTRSESPRVLRDLVLLLVGAVLGGGIATGAFLAVDDDPSPVAGGDENVLDPGAGDGEETEPTVDPTDTEFGQLTEESEQSGVRVQWASELLAGDGGEADFVTAHRGDTVAFIHGDIRIVDSDGEIQLCDGGGCRAVAAEEARESLSTPAQPFFEIVRNVVESTASPDYRITGETELESGIFEQCGQYDPAAFGLVLPDGVVMVSQCVDAARNVPLRMGLQGENQSLGGATLTALADAEDGDFATG